MDIRVLKYFLTIVREGSFSRAADTLFVTQPTLSRQIAQLENELETKLFIRDKQLSLTESGYALLKKAEQMVELMESIKADFQSAEQIQGKISIGCGSLNSLGSLMQYIASFRRIYPNIHFDIDTNSADHIKEKLSQGLLDLGLLLEPVEIDQYQFIRMPEKERWGVLAPADSALAQKPDISKEQLLELPLLIAQRPSLQKELLNWMNVDLSQLNIIATYNLIPSAASMVMQRLGYALTLEGAVNLYDERKLTFRPLNPALEMTSVLAWKKHAHSYATVQRFVDHVKKEMQADKC